MAGTRRFEHDGIEGLRVGLVPGQVNTTCIVYRLGSTVIDTGPPNQWRKVRRFLEERRVRQVVVTHHHEDHSGNLGRLGAAAGHGEAGLAIYSPASSIERLSRGFPLRLYQHLFWGRPRRCRPEPVPEVIDAGDFGTLRALAAPGHSEDMTCYLQPGRGYLFTGDLYLSSKVKYLRKDEDLPAQIESLRRILEEDFGTIFCSHRGVVPSGKEALRRKLDFLESLRERVLHFHGEGLSVREITRRVLGREGMMPWMTGFHFSKKNLVEACLEAGE